MSSKNSADEDASKSEEMSSSDVSVESFLTLPEEIISMTCVSDLKDAVDRCKAMVMEKSDESEEKKLLIRRLIELRLRLHDVKEAISDKSPIEESMAKKKVVLGHHFVCQSHPKSLTTNYCDRCSGVIWNAIHSWHLCSDCNYKCHLWCLSQVCRLCAHVVVSETPSYSLEICPEAPDGLSSQNYRCAECLTLTKFGESILEPRRCDYNGQYYCPTCHWNSTSVIPARVIHNWDFTERRVCRSSKQILTLLLQRPILNLESLNPSLFALVCDLSALKVLRQRLLHVKKYLISCKAAADDNLLWQLTDRYHFIEGTEKYSIQDLVDLRSGVLLPYLHKIMNGFIKHITQDCKICREQGYICEGCRDKDDIIFPFDADVECCSKCGTAYHLPCWVSQFQKCSRCKRRELRLAAEKDDSS